MHEEKRKYARVSTVLSVTLSAGDRSLQGIVYNASRGGILVQSRESVEVDTHLDIAIDVRTPIKAKGRVAWVQKEEHVYMIGIDFEELHPNAVSAWTNVLKKFTSLLTQPNLGFRM
ncbi:MAG: PilZ domain-containing protein [Pseudomonadota bacterium]